MADNPIKHPLIQDISKALDSLSAAIKQAKRGGFEIELTINGDKTLRVRARRTEQVDAQVEI